MKAISFRILHRFRSPGYLALTMYPGAFHLARRALALAGLLATLSGAVAPVCAGMTMKQVAGEHCGDSKDQHAPSPGMPNGPSHDHHGASVCTMAACVAIPMIPVAAVVHQIPAFSSVLSTEVALASVASQHTTPPPRS